MNEEKTKQLEEVKKIIIPILKRNGVVRAGIFGSYARGEATKKSDIDVLIQFKGRKSLLDLAGLEIELEEKLMKKVDVVTYNSLNPLIKEQVLKEEIEVL